MDKERPAAVASSRWSITSWSVDRWLGVGGIAAAIICAWWAIQAGKQEPLLTCGVHPLKTQFRRADFERDFGFTYKGKPIDAETVTSVQFAVWNAGTRSIKEADILEPIQISMPQGVPIVTAVVKKLTRAVCGFSCDPNPGDFAAGFCRVHWRILEPGDGAIVQIIYAGTTSDLPRLTGTIEGQPGISQVSFMDIDHHARPHEVLGRYSRTLLIAMMLLTTIAGGRVVIRSFALAKRDGAPRTFPIITLVIAGVPIAAILTMVWAMGLWRSTGPPFGW